MNDDYLWDRSGPPDPEIVRLERVLGRLRDSDPIEAPQARARIPAFIRWPMTALPLAAAALLVVAVGTLVQPQRPPATDTVWQVGRLEGTPTIASRRMGDRGELRVGRSLETDATARARISVADIGHVDVDPGTRIDLVRAHGSEYRLRLARGTIHARIVAPPGQFIIETPSSTAVDLGCAYTLDVDDEGAGRVRVTLGWIAFESRGRESFIPAGAMCATRPRVGPGTPHYEDVSEAMRAAIDTLDFGRPARAERASALDRVLSEARPRDAMTLWHLLTRVEQGERNRVFDRLSALAPPPAGVTREGILHGDRTMLDQWWNGLELGDVSTWRQWKQLWSERTSR